jgi:predicted neuraminidase
MIYNSPTKIIENTLAVTRNGTLVMMFRTSTGSLYRSWSYNSGLAWTVPAPSGLPNPNSKTFMMTDSSHNQIIAYNPTTKGRNPLALAISTDDGMSFSEFANLDPGETTLALEYPTTAQVGGIIFTAFSANHYTGIKLAKTAMPDMQEAVTH